MKYIINIIIFFFSANLLLAQEESKIVKKKVLFIQHFVGTYHFPKSTGELLNTGNLGLDQIHLILLPYEERPDGSHWPFLDYLMDVNRHPFIYLYNDIFLSSVFSSIEYKNFLKEKKWSRNI